MKKTSQEAEKFPGPVFFGNTRNQRQIPGRQEPKSPPEPQALFQSLSQQCPPQAWPSHGAFLETPMNEAPVHINSWKPLC